MVKRPRLAQIGASWVKQVPGYELTLSLQFNQFYWD